jgi:hypothetical protein
MRRPYLCRSLLTASLACRDLSLEDKHTKPSSMWMNTTTPCFLHLSIGDLMTLVSRGA